MNLLPPDAAGADVVGNHGDADAPAAPPVIEIKPCKDVPDGMDIISTSTDGSHPIQIHFSPAGWAEFVAAVKAGKYDTAGT